MALLLQLGQIVPLNLCQKRLTITITDKIKYYAQTTHAIYLSKTTTGQLKT